MWAWACGHHANYRQAAHGINRTNNKRSARLCAPDTLVAHRKTLPDSGSQTMLDIPATRDSQSKPGRNSSRARFDSRAYE